MRIIAGRFKGLELKAPKTGTRPTTDRTKEAIFSRLESWGVLDDSRILDLFAGTGALGVEALSRGARELVAVESASQAAKLISATFSNLKRQRLWENTMSATLVRKRAEQYVPTVEHETSTTGITTSPHVSFDVIFIDPPYAFTTEACELLMNGLVTSGMATERSVIVLERSTRSEAPTLPTGWQITDRRDYGETAVFYIEAIEVAPVDDAH